MDDGDPPTRTRSSRLHYQRVLLKLSGEALQGTQGHGIAPEVLAQIAAEVHAVHALGAQLGVVIGGGNIFRGLKASASGMNRASADYMGMLATVMNCLALQDALERRGVATRLLSAISMNAVAEPYIQRRALRHLEKGRVVLFAAGTGNPYFTTDTAAALRALEIGAQVLIKATKVDGVYSADPALHADATFYPELSYLDVLSEGLKVMDATAVSLCMDNALPLIVLNMQVPGNIGRALRGERVGSLVGARVGPCDERRPAPTTPRRRPPASAARARPARRR